MEPVAKRLEVGGEIIEDKQVKTGVDFEFLAFLMLFLPGREEFLPKYLEITVF